MNGIYNIDNMSAKLSKEHKIITEYVAKFNNSYKNQDKEFKTANNIGPLLITQKIA